MAMALVTDNESRAVPTSKNVLRILFTKMDGETATNDSIAFDVTEPKTGLSKATVQEVAKSISAILVTTSGEKVYTAGEFKDAYYAVTSYTALS